MIDTIISLYLVTVFLVTMLFWMVYWGKISFGNKWTKSFNGIIRNSFMPQKDIYGYFQGEVNKAGKIIIVAFSCIFLIPANLVIFVTQIVRIVCLFAWKIFLIVFGEKK